MNTNIGRAFETQPRRRDAAAGVAFATIVLDWLTVRYFGRAEIVTLDVIRVALAIAAAVVLLWLARWDRASVGLTLRPAPSVWYWIKAVVVLAAVLGAVCAAAVVVIRWMGYRVDTTSMFNSPAQFVPFVLEYCVLIVVFEETIYRLAVCTAAVRLVGAWGTVVLSGVVFALLHYVYGNLSVPSALAGFVLGWAYLRSGSLLVPMGLHALGNGAIGVYQAVLLFIERAR